MRNILRNTAVAALLSGTLLFGQAQDSATAQRASAAQQEVDWLDAPTPDGSPTLRETSDWLAKTLIAYGGDDPADGSHARIGTAHIDNDCSFHVHINVTSVDDLSSALDVSLPLGAVVKVSDGVGEVPNVMISTGSVKAILLATHTETSTGSRRVQFVGLLLGSHPSADQEETAPQEPDQMLPRIIRALQHAVDLCRSSYQPPAQTKEPF